MPTSEPTCAIAGRAASPLFPTDALFGSSSLVPATTSLPLLLLLSFFDGDKLTLQHVESVTPLRAPTDLSAATGRPRSVQVSEG